MATVIPIGQTSSGAERRAIAHLRDHLPKSYLILHNFEIKHGDELFEVDLAIIAPHAVYLVDVKGTRGLIDVYGPKWYPEGRQPYTSPLLKLQVHARSLEGAITESQPSRRDLEGVYVDAVVLLTAPDVALQDPGGRDAPSVTTLKKSSSFFQNTSRISGKYSKNIAALTSMVLKAIQGAARPRSGQERFGNWEVLERLGGTDAYTEYRAYNVFAGERSGHVLLRVYRADPYLPDEERAQQRTRIANAYHALNRMPGHSNIVGVRDFFPNEPEDRFVLVTEDIPGQALRLHIDKPGLTLTLDQKLRIAGDLLSALAHAHEHDVIHRNLTPSTILVGSDGRPHVVGFDFARAGTDRSRTIATEIVDELEPLYTAPEAYREPQSASPASDVFSAGVVLYELFTGEKPFDSPTEVFDRSGEFATMPSRLRSELPEGFDGWLQSLCAFDPHNRPTAAEAAEGLAALLAPAEGMRADELIEEVLARNRGELRPLLALVGNAETDWLELKASLLPDPSLPVPEGMNEADHHWHVTRAVVALANSEGGAVLLGVDDNGLPVDLSFSDPKGYRREGGWDLFSRKVLDKALFRPSGWKTAKRGKWRLDVNRLKRCVSLRQAKLDGRDVVAIVVRCAKTRDDLVLVDHTLQGQTTGPILFVRQRGDVGRIDRLEGQPAIDGWLESRRLDSTFFKGLQRQLEKSLAEAAEPENDELRMERDWAKLPAGTELTPKFVVERPLGRGQFGVVYKVIDTLGDVSRVVKLILHDRHSTLDRLKKEYRTLLKVPEHRHVVKVIDADLLPRGGPPFIVFEYVEGLDVDKMIEDKKFAPEDVLDLARQVAEGLTHLHKHGVYHCDIKPRNLLWTGEGVRILDFNVSVLAEAANGHGGGSRRYIPPDLDLTAVPQTSDLVDRDLFATGVTLYEVLTGHYPWGEVSSPPPGELPLDPREDSRDLSSDLVEVILKAIAPKRADRFGSAAELQEALAGVKQARRRRLESESTSTWSFGDEEPDRPIPPNTNPFVERLLTLYSQSRRSNVGTRGLDELGRLTWVETALDRELEPAVFKGEFSLVVITGNAGDGKTAFLQRLEKKAIKHQAEFQPPLVNGSRFRIRGRRFQTNYDGSQDEGERTSDEVLRDFFAPFAGDDAGTWPTREVRLIAINEGRLVDFLTSEGERFPLLGKVIREGLASGSPESGVAVVNLKLRSVVVDPTGKEIESTGRADGSIFTVQLRRMTNEHLWQPCHTCDLKDRCYVFHNARTFQDETAGARVAERLKTLYTLTHLRGRQHITLRELRSALAYMIAGTRDCREIHDLYGAADHVAIAQGFYFNSWMGGDAPIHDRFLSLLKDVDVGQATDPRLDRALGFVSPGRDRDAPERHLFRFSHRGDFDREVLRRLFDDLPRDFSGRPTAHRAKVHRSYVAMARRRAFFERRDDVWREMLPYRSAQRMLDLIHGEVKVAEALPSVLRAINRGEGLRGPDRLGGKLALQVRQVERGTVRSYRVFPAERFSLEVLDEARSARFVEHMPTGLVLRYRGVAGNQADLAVNLDVFEMLWRLNEGYRPSLEEEQGYYLSLAIFKNLLGSEPYQEVLLTTTGHDFYRIERHGDGRLEMHQLGMGVV